MMAYPLKKPFPCLPGIDFLCDEAKFLQMAAAVNGYMSL